MATSSNPLFECLNSILTSKEYWMVDAEREKQYSPHFINLGLSQHIDCILHVNEINQNWHLPAKMQYDYYFYSIRKMRRKFGKWSKHVKNEDLELVMNYYKVRRQVAQQYMEVIDSYQLGYIREEMDTGEHK